MNLAIWSSLLLSAAVAAPPLETGAVYTYQGYFDAERGSDAFVTRKTFELTLLVGRTTDDESTVYWMLEENGRGGWHWPDRFGRATVNARGRVADGSVPSLLYQRSQGNSIVSLGLPVIATEEPLAADATWDEGRLTYEVKELGKRGEQPAWRVEASNPYGRVRSFWVAENSRTVIASTQRVFIGQGEQHELRYELKERQSYDAAALAAAASSLEQLIALRNELAIEPQTVQVDWTKEQLGTLAEKLPGLSEPKQPGVLSKLVAAVGDDVKAQNNRAGAVDSLVKKAIGKTVESLQLVELSGRPIDAESLKGKTLVLHFWEYRDTPLEEPYGQIGYLDFMHRRLSDAPVAVVGVVVGDRLEEADRGKSAASARKLRSFMNLGYPLMFDNGLLKELGDPRTAEARLPLWVVIGTDGKVREYFVGHYDVDRDLGLKKLEQIARDAAK